MASDYSVLIFGLDGATFDLMLPFIEQGHLPCLGRLLREGAWSPLRSTIPPITPCAWSSFMTGLNPGKHGLFDFVEPVGDGKGFRFTNATCRQGETLWGCLSRHGRKVGVLNVPMTYPPQSVNGYLISGMDTPNERSRFTYPETLRQELHEQTIDYRIDVQHLGNMRSDHQRDLRLRELCEVETIRTNALRYLRKKYPSDFSMVVYTATDQVQHHFWHYMDPKHDKFDARGAERYGNAIRDVYIHVDRQIASVLAERGENTLVLIMSDHGFGPTTNMRLRLNQALAYSGQLNFASEGVGGRSFRRLAGLADQVLRSTLSNGAKRLLAGMFPKLRVWFEKADEARIDWDRTRAYVNEAYRSSPAVWLNKTGRSDAELEQALVEAEAALRNLADPKTGKPCISHLYRGRDVYNGACMGKAPDLIPSWWEDGFLIDQSNPGAPASTDVERSQGSIQGGVEFAGSHRLDGVFVMAGGPVRSGHAFTGARIIDVAPTVLYLMGLPIPQAMDGRPLIEALDSAFVASRPVVLEGDGKAPPPFQPQAEAVFNAEEEALIADRLQSMGYIE
jgi:predicted AlkP superfamily phosphohydrolase/phosphomutase